MQAPRQCRRQDNARLGDRAPYPVRALRSAPQRAFVRIWSNQRDSLIGGKRSRTLSVNEVHVSILIQNDSNGRCVWQGEAIHAIGGRDDLAIAEQFIHPLARHIGRSVRAAPITLN